jgi:hypothetical protein
MRNSSATFGVAALALVFGFGADARADWIAWTYSWSNSPGYVLADIPAGGGRISLSDVATQTAVGDSDIVATNIRTFSSAPSTNPDTFTAKAYSLNLTLTDSASNQSAQLIFAGVFNGTLTATSANITNTFTSASTQTVVLGDNRYTVTLNAYTPPGPMGSSAAGSIGAHATVLVQSILSAPEPASLAIAGAAAPLLAFALRRRRPDMPPSPATA